MLIFNNGRIANPPERLLVNYKKIKFYFVLSSVCIIFASECIG